MKITTLVNIGFSLVSDRIELTILVSGSNDFCLTKCTKLQLFMQHTASICHDGGLERRPAKRDYTIQLNIADIRVACMNYAL